MTTKENSELDSQSDNQENSSTIYEYQRSKIELEELLNSLSKYFPQDSRIMNLASSQNINSSITIKITSKSLNLSYEIINPVNSEILIRKNPTNIDQKKYKELYDALLINYNLLKKENERLENKCKEYEKIIKEINQSKNFTVSKVINRDNLLFNISEIEEKEKKELEEEERRYNEKRERNIKERLNLTQKINENQENKKEFTYKANSLIIKEENKLKEYFRNRSCIYLNKKKSKIIDSKIEKND